MDRNGANKCGPEWDENMGSGRRIVGSRVIEVEGSESWAPPRSAVWRRRGILRGWFDGACRWRRRSMGDLETSGLPQGMV